MFLFCKHRATRHHICRTHTIRHLFLKERNARVLSGCSQHCFGNRGVLICAWVSFTKVSGADRAARSRRGTSASRYRLLSYHTFSMDPSVSCGNQTSNPECCCLALTRSLVHSHLSSWNDGEQEWRSSSLRPWGVNAALYLRCKTSRAGRRIKQRVFEVNWISELPLLLDETLLSLFCVFSRVLSSSP